MVRSIRKRVTLCLCLLFVTLTATAAMAAGLPHIVLLATGGTIAGTGASAGEAGYKPSALPVEKLVGAVPEIASFARLSGEQIAQVDSQAMTTEIWLKLARRINELLGRPDVDGIVVTHGTDTLEETAYFLHLTVKSRKPVVITGSMRPATSLSPDGPINLFNAVSVAASPLARGKGVLVVLNDRIHSAREVTKTNTTAVDTFQSPGTGPLGTVFYGKIELARMPVRRHTIETPFDVSGLETLPRVFITYGHAGNTPELIDAVARTNADGIVNAGVGNGNASPAVLEALGKARRSGIAVVRAARAGSGHVTLGAEVDDAAYGFVVADDLNPQKARILLMLALTQTRSPEGLQRLFFRH
ncbi:MAG TPA: type II asparaginase [Candidatus Ozemobacteraceae bacterium]|nr:type II asparaginase [Candidatus Ozemobacteraceae bacterium]